MRKYFSAIPLISLAVLALTLLLDGCTSGAPTADPDGPVLTGFDALPKALATIALSPTPNAPQVQATRDSRRATATLPPPTLTPSATPYVGIFMGAPTFAAGGIILTRTRSVVVVTLPPQTGTKTAANAASGANAATSAPAVAKNCTAQPAAQFANAIKNAAVQARIGCPTGSPYGVKLVGQPFQTGFMFWRETKDIYVISTAGLQKGSATDTFWRVPDTWNESLPASDPGQVAPAGLLQPVRGFGYVWRSNTAMRNSLGWALSNEVPFDSTWQDFEHGWMMTTNAGTVFALVPLDGPPVTTGVHFGPLPQ